MTSLRERGVFDAVEAAEYLHINVKDLRKMLQRREIPNWRTGGPDRGDYRISKAAADEWIAQQEERGEQEAGL